MASTDDSLPSCLNDPNFAVICAFLQKFSTKLNIVYPNFNDLQKMIENTDEVAEDLKNLIVKLLRKTRKTVHNEKWEHALSKFCYTYSSQDAWEIERFGFKKANLSVKLRVIKEVLESQFERNLKFKTELNLLSAEELRSQPLGKDKLGNAYWSTIDSNLNLRIYQEHLDEDIWKICAHNRDELVKLIACLKGNELVMPSLVGVVDEDSNSMPQEKLDALKNGDIDSDIPNKDSTKLVVEKSKPESKQFEKILDDEDDPTDDDNESNISEMDVSSQDASECSASVLEAKTNTSAKDKLPPIVVTKTLANKNISKNESNNSKLPAKRRLDSESGDESASKVPKLQRPTLLTKNQTIKTNKFAHLEGGDDDGEDDDDDDDEEEEEEEEDEEEEEEDEDGSGTEDETDDDELGEEIVEPVMHIKGVGSGAANKGTFLDFIKDMREEDDIGEAIEEDVIFIVGDGSGVENEVGNPENKPKSDKPMFFFGQAGCLKLSPIKHPNLPKLENNIENNVKTSDLFKDISTVVDGGQSSTDLSDSTANFKTISEEPEFEKTNENDVDIVKVTQMPNIEVLKSLSNDAISSKTDIVLTNSDEKPLNESELINSIDEKPIATNINPEPQAENIQESTCTNEVAADLHIPSATTMATPEGKTHISVETMVTSAEKMDTSTEKMDTSTEKMDTSTEKIDTSMEKMDTSADTMATFEDKIPISDEKISTSDDNRALSDENMTTSDEKPVTENIEKISIAEEKLDAVSEPELIENIEQTSQSNQLNAASEETVQSDIRTAPEESIVRTDGNEVSNDETVTTSNTLAVSSENVSESPSIDVDKPIQLVVEPLDVNQPTEDSAISTCNSTASIEDVDISVPETKTEKIIERESAVKSEEITNVLSDDLVFQKQVIVMEDNKISNSLSNPELKSESVACTSIDNKCESMLDKTEVNLSSETFKDAEKESVSQERLSASDDRLETNSCDSKGESLTIDSRSCEDIAQQGVELAASETTTPIDTKQDEFQSDEVTPETSINLNKEDCQLQTSQSTTDGDNATLNASAPENFSTLTATNQSDEIVSEPVIDASTPDVTSISMPSFEDQDNLTSGSILDDDESEATETPADISVKEIGKFQIFNRKVGDELSREIVDQNDAASKCPPKLQYDGSEETKTPLVLTHPRNTEVPPTENNPSSIDLNKESKSNESASSSNPPQISTNTSKLLAPLQIKSPVEQTTSNKEPLTKFPISFINTQINNRKRPLSFKNDFDTDDESSSETSEEEIEVKRQKTKPKFSHLAARKNAEIKRKATQIDCSTDEDEPVNKVQLKMISTELSKMENIAKQKKNENEKSLIKVIQEDNAVKSTSEQIVSTVSVADLKPPSFNEVQKNPVKAEYLNLSNTPSVEQSTVKLPVEEKDLPENATISLNAIDLSEKSIGKSDDRQLKVQSLCKAEEAEMKITSGKDVKSSEDIKLTEDVKSKEELKIKEEIKLRAEIEGKVDVKANQEINSKVDIKSTEDLKPNEKVKPNEEVKPKVETKAKLEAEMKTGEEIKSIPSEEVKSTPVSQPTKIETPRSKPGPKSKKPGFVPETTILGAENSTLKHEVTIEHETPKDEETANIQLETIQTTTRSRVTRASQPGPPAKATATPSKIIDSTVPEPSPKPVSLTVSKPTPAKTTPQPKKPPKTKPPPKVAVTKKPPQPVTPKPPTKPVNDTAASKKETPKKRKLMGLLVDDNAILATNDGEAPVRQSRRIAQIKIKEEAERRKEEEMALKQMKAASEKKKKVVDDNYTVKSEESDASEEDSEHKLELKKKFKKKVKGGMNPWQTDSDHDESDVSEEEHYESDHNKLIFFKSDHEFSPESEIEDESQIVQTKRARTAQKDVDETIDDGYACQKCNKHDHPEWILLCDKCDKGYHCSCLIPMLFIIPEGDWFCPPCQQEKLIETLECQLVNFDKEVKEKELEELKRQRAAFTSISVANVVPDDRDEDVEEYPKTKSIRKRPTTSRRRRRNDASDHSNGSSSSSSESSRSDKNGSSSNSSDDEPIYKLRKRRQTNISYRFNEYDDLINSAIKKEMDNAEGAGNLGRGKDISTIIQADKDEKRIKQMEGDDDDDDEGKDPCTTEDVPLKTDEQHDENKEKSESVNAKASESDSDSEPIRPKALKRPLNKKGRKKHRKLNSLDIESEDDGSDDDFRTSSFSEDEEDENFSAESESDSSLDFYRRKKNKKHETRRSVRSRRTRYDEAFINDSDGDDIDEPKTRTKKKKKEDSDFSDDNESTDEEAEEDVDSEDLCDSTDSNESDRGWRSKKSKKTHQKKNRPTTDNSNASKSIPKKKVKKVEDTAFRAGIPKSKGKSISDDESDDEDVQTKSRRTRGKKLTYLNLLDEFESSDSDGIKPGVKRPDTPPEERAAFIKKQEEIKRMLAEKNTEAAAALAAPKLNASTPEKSRRPAGPADSLSTIPRQIIQNAKALDPDYKKGRDSDDTDGFDDDLPDDFDPEGMDEEEIAKMMEEEDFAQQQLKAVGERVRKMKEAELLQNKKKEATKVVEPSAVTPSAPPANVPSHLATPPSVVVPPSSFSPRPSLPLSHLIRPPHSSPLSPGNMQHIQPHSIHHPQHSPHGPQHLPIHPHISPLGPHSSHHMPAHNQAHPPHQIVRGPPHHLLHPGQHPMQHFNPLQRHPMQLTQSPHISPNSQSSHMPHRPMHPSIRSPHHPLQIHPSQMQSHPPPSMVADYPGDSKMMKLTKSGVEPKKRGRKSKAELQAIEQAKVLSAPDPSSSMGPSLIQHTTGQEPIIPTTVLAVQNTRLMDPSELGPPGASVSDVKKRGRRKKFTPLRETLNKPAAESAPGGIEQKTNPILAERLGIQDNRNNLSIATPPQLFSPSAVGQPSVITRLPRPPLGSPYGSGGPAQQRFYPPQAGQPPNSLAQNARIPFSPHGPPPPLTSSPAPASNGAPATNHYVQAEQMPRQSGHFRSPAPAHFSGPPSNYQPAPGLPPLIHRTGLQPIEAASSTPQDYSAPTVPVPYAASYGTYYPPHHPAAVEHRPPQPSAPSTVAPTNSSFEQFDNAKNTPPHDRATPNSYQSPPTEEPAASSSEFSGLVSYFSSQQDDLET